MNFQIPGKAIAVTPSDTVNLPYTSGFYVGGAGNVTVQTEAGDITTFNACPVGLIVPIRITKVLATGTTATLLTRFGSDGAMAGDGGELFFLVDANGNFITEVDGDYILVPGNGLYI